MKHCAGILLFLVVDTSLHGPMIDARIMIISTRKICISPGLKKKEKEKETHSLLLLLLLLLLLFFFSNEYCSLLFFQSWDISSICFSFLFISIVKYFEILIRMLIGVEIEERQITRDATISIPPIDQNQNRCFSLPSPSPRIFSISISRFFEKSNS